MFKDKILEQIKTKYKDLGLSAKILEGYATRLAKTVTEENKIDEAVNDLEPELQIWQSVLDVNRKEVAELKKQLISKNTEQAKGEDPKPNTDSAKVKEKDKEPDPVLSLLKEMKGEIQALKTEKVATGRKSGYEALFSDVKDDKLKANKLAQFDRLSFKDDEDFNSFIESEKNFIKDRNQSQASENLKTSRPIIGQAQNGIKPDEKLLDSVVDSFKI